MTPCSLAPAPARSQGRPARAIVLLLAALLVGFAPGASADDGPGEGKPVTFGAAAQAPAAAPAAGDFKGMLKVCDGQLEACKADEVGIPFLGAAYLALWAILIIFLIAVKRGQGQMESEVAELRARLRRLEGSA